ncbi:MAG TPA: CBS domain-containing protein [Candidatus Sulfotelmatobacter sp.]|nr:CBS domain-containing protein [Candidatus Sulfotelmatobacter sp.]
MRVREVMTVPVETCGSDSELAAAAMLMWDHDCGALPVTEPGSSRVVGVITDRDICMAVATRRRGPHEIRVCDAMSRSLQSIGPEEELSAALQRMAESQVRRLPVIDASGAAVGMLSLNDVVLRVETPRLRPRRASLSDAVMHAFKAVCGHRQRLAGAGP